MGLVDKAVIKAIELAAETNVGKAATAASLRFAEEMSDHYLPPMAENSEAYASRYGVADSRFTNAELARLISPERLGSPFERFQNLGAFTSAAEVTPLGRVRTGFFRGNEDYWLDSLNERFAKGHIDANTLLVANTGHGATIGKAMAERFRSDIFMHLPKAENRIDLERIQEQGQTFFKPIQDALRTGPRQGSSTLIIKDYHLPELSLDTVATLPPASQLKSMGLSRVFYGIETSPFQGGPKAWSGRELSPLETWLTKLHLDGMTVEWDGLDIRPNESNELVEKSTSMTDYSSGIGLDDNWWNIVLGKIFPDYLS